MRSVFNLLALGLLLVGASLEARAQDPGSCTLGRAQADLDINNVFARVFNTGSLFFGNTTTNGDGYLVPKASGNSPIFASGLWVGGRVNGELRVAGARYTNFNFWPGPLGDNGRPVNPSTCAAFDKIYSVTRDDIRAFEAGSGASEDLTNWPWQLGAPVIDGDGNPDNYDLAAGDRPDIVGDQGLWWVMNDVGNVHLGTNTPPLGIEVQVLAFAFSRADALGNTTFYRYRVINKGSNPITDTYLSVFSDPDLGNAADDFVGYDVDLGMGYTYNAVPVDAVYGIPPAVGYDFFQGPIVDGDTLGATAFSYFINGGPGATVDPSTGEGKYNFMQGLWGDATPMRAIGNGYNQTSGEVTRFAFPGDPVTGQAWSEVNNGTATPANQPGDRRHVIHTGPFTLQPNDPQDIVFGIVFAQGTSNLNSITALRAADRLAQAAYDANFQLPPPPPPPALCVEGSAVLAPGSGRCFESIARNNAVTLVWGYPESSANYLGRFEVEDPFLAGQNVPDNTYNFEGFNIYRYPTSGFATDQRELIATYDIINGVTEVRDELPDPSIGGDLRPFVVARGTDSGLRYSIDITNLTNFTDYYYGITAYSYNEFSSPRVLESSATLITARPSRLLGGIELNAFPGDSLSVTATTQTGAGLVRARVIDPTRVTGATYEVRFFTPLNADGTTAFGFTTYSIVNTTTGQNVLDGQTYYAQTGEALPTGDNVQVIDGFTFDILGPAPGSIANFQTTANAAGPLVPPDYAALTGSGSPLDTGFPTIIGASRNDFQPTVTQQTGPPRWFIHQGGNQDPETGYLYETFLARTTRNGNNNRAIGANDYEWRFTGTSLAWRAFTDGGIVSVPFELWDLGTTPDDPTDDVRLIPWMLPADSSDVDQFSLGINDHVAHPQANDPHSDWIYWYRPVDQSAGQAGYLAYEAALQAGTYGGEGQEIFARMVLVNLNGGLVTNANAPNNYNAQRPEPGTIFRITTLKANLPGDVFTINTAEARASDPTDEGRQASLDMINIVPNPYLGASDYETGNLSRVVRFTNLPEQATTIRIFTVAGSLVQTLRKEGLSRSLDWNMETSNNLPIASGMYFVHLDVEGVGQRSIKLGVVNRRTQITVF